MFLIMGEIVSEDAKRKTKRSYGAAALRLTHNDPRKYVGLKQNQNAYQHREHQTVKKDIAQNLSFVTIPTRRGTGHDDRLRVDHLSHYAARAVRRAHKDWTQAQLRSCDLLQTAEEDVRRSVGAGQ